MEGKGENRSTIKILIVEDNPVSQLAIKCLLETLGCFVEVACDGRSALKACEQFFNIILLDINLPDMNGTEVAKKIREIKYQKKNRPQIIACTAHEKKLGENYISCGFDDFITKSSLEEDLKRLIERLSLEDSRENK